MLKVYKCLMIKSKGSIVLTLFFEDLTVEIREFNEGARL